MYKTAEQIADSVLTKLATAEEENKKKFDPGYATRLGLSGAALGGMAGGAATRPLAAVTNRKNPRLNDAIKRYLSDPEFYTEAGKSGRTKIPPFEIPISRRKWYPKEDRVIGRIGKRFQKATKRNAAIGAGVGLLSALAPYLATRNSE